jgi:hypothetical protein
MTSPAPTIADEQSSDRTAGDGGYRRPAAALKAVTLVLAIAVVAGPVLMATWFALCPQYGNPGCPTDPQSAIDAYRAAPAWLLQPFLLVTLLLPYVAPASFVALGVASFRRSPWLACLAVLAGWLGSTLPWGAVFDQANLLYVASRMQDVSSFVSVVHAYPQSPYVAVAFVGWGLHLVGYLLAGAAFLRFGGALRWAGVALIAATILQGPLAYGTGINALQVGGYLLIAVACLPAARILLVYAPYTRPR